MQWIYSVVKQTPFHDSGPLSFKLTICRRRWACSISANTARELGFWKEQSVECFNSQFKGVATLWKVWSDGGSCDTGIVDSLGWFLKPFSFSG